MRISFDLDEVLFVDPKKYETEPPLHFPFDRIYRERLRKGTVWLIGELHRQGFEVWVYTSSYRSEAYIRTLFLLYHVSFDGIVNGFRHDLEVQRGRPQRLPTKMPGAFRIGLHIDDEISVIQSGKAYGFRVMRVYEPDSQWADKILAEANRIRKLEEGH